MINGSERLCDNLREKQAVEHTEKTNFRHLVMDIAWFGLALAATSRFLSIFAIRLGASATDLGIISALPSLVLIVSSGLALWWRKRFNTSLTALQAPAFFFRTVFILPALTPFMPPEWQIPWLILSVTLPAIPQGIAGSVFLVLMRESISEKQITALTSRRQVSLNAGVAAGALGFGLLLESVPFPHNYQLMFVVAFLFALMSQWHVWRLHILYPNNTHPNPTTVPESEEKPVIEARPAGRIWTHPGFRFVIFAVLIMHLTFFSTIAIVPLHLVDNLNASESFVALFGMVELLAGMLIATQTDRIARYIGQRGLMGMGMIGAGLAAITIALAPNTSFTLISAALSGASWTAAVVGLFSYFYTRTPKEYMAQGSIAYQQLAGLGMFIGPLIGSTLADMGVTLVLVILVGAVMRFGAGVALMDRSMLRGLVSRRQRQTL